MAAFRMDQKSGVLSTRSQLDREKASLYSIVVHATDQASPVSERRSSRLLFITLLATNFVCYYINYLILALLST